MLAWSDALHTWAARWTSSTLYWVLAILAVVGLQSALTLGHWAWLDEWQAVQIAVQTPDQTALFHNLAYEGHPPLWYWVLQGTAKLVPLLWVLPVTALALGLITQLLILFASPFTRPERLLLALSEFILFEFNTVSRSLTLGCALIVLAASLWRSRFVWLPIALLPLCDFLLGAISGILFLLLWRRRNWSWNGASLWLAVGILAAISVIPPADIEPAHSPDNPFYDLGAFLSRTGTLLFPFQFQGFVPSWKGTAFFLFAPFASLGFFWFAWRHLSDAPWPRLLFGGYGFLCLAMTLTVYRLSTRHLMLIALLLVTLEWILRLHQDRSPTRAFKLWLTGSAVAGLLTGGIALLVPFNTAHIAARDMAKRGFFQERLVVFPHDNAHGIPILTGLPIEHPYKHCQQSIVRWDTRADMGSPLEMMQELQRLRARKGRSYILTNIEFDEIPPTVVELVYRSPRGFDGTRYLVYLLGRDVQPKPPPTAACIHGLKPFRTDDIAP